MLVAAVLALLVASVTSGCGPQTGDANRLVHEAGDIIAGVSSKVRQTDALLDQAAQQSNLRQLESEKATLSQAMSILDEAIPEIEAAKSKIDEAAGLNISDAYHQYLQAKGRALEAALVLRQTQRQKIELLLSDPGFDKADTQQKFAELQKTEAQQNQKVHEAENEADRIADEHPEEIQ